MKIILYVFSGTGNTLAVAELYKKYLENGGNTVDIYRISAKSGEMPSPENYDLVGIGYPIHAFSAPEPAINFCKNIQIFTQNKEDFTENGADFTENKGVFTQKKPAFIFKTSGEGLHLNDCSSQKCIKILQKRGYDVLSERHIVMPYNMIYRHNNSMAKHMWIYAHALADLNCREIMAGTRIKVKQAWIKKMWVPPIRFVEQKFAHMHGTAFKVDTKKCVNCGRCVRVCPMNNIELKDGKYKFGHKCVLCMGCSFGCPKDAIKVGVFKYWKVNGSYRLNELKADESLTFPYIPDHAKGIYKLYKKYYREADARLAAAGIDINDYI